jgi:hypothetical protein
MKKQLVLRLLLLTISFPLIRLEEAEASDPMSYLAYYKYLLPWKSIFVWLNRTYSPATAASAHSSPSSSSSSSTTISRNFTHREFTFTLQNEAYLRYNSFSTPEELKREVCRLNPARFEIGPVYSAKVSRPLSSSGLSGRVVLTYVSFAAKRQEDCPKDCL